MTRGASRTRRGLIIPAGMVLAPGRGQPTGLWRPGWNGSGMPLAPRPPVGLYRGRARTVLTNGTGQAKVSGGTARVQLGPQGLGTVWYPQAAAIATTSGAADSSTCTIYLGTQAVLSQIAGQSYTGGGDSIGLASPPLGPGQFLIAVWTTAVNGDIASLVLYGEQEVLT